MFADFRLAYLESVRSALSLVVYPIQYAVNLPLDVSRQLAQSITTQRRLLRENADLQEHILLLESRSQRIAALESENMRLRELLDSSVKAGERVLVADLLAVDLDFAVRQVVLNKGSRQGVFVGQPVVDASGIMGQITHVGPLTSTAMLLTDANHAIPVQVNRTGLRAIAAGTGNDDVLELLYVPNNGDLRENDLIVSSGLGGRFPVGYPVGTVENIANDSRKPFAEVTAKPSARVLRAREVLLVWPEQVLPKTGHLSEIGLFQ